MRYSDALVRTGRLKRGELRREHIGLHEMAAAALESVHRDGRIDSQVHKHHPHIRRAEHITLRTPKARACDDAPRIRSALGRFAYTHDPRPPILVRQCLAPRHLGDSCGRMKIIGIAERRSARARERLADGRFAGAGHAHDDDTGAHGGENGRIFLYT